MHRFNPRSYLFFLFLPSLLLSWTLLVFLPVEAAAAEGGEAPWRTPFPDDSGALLAAAAAVEHEDDASVVVLLEEGHVRFDAEGRQTYRRRLVYRIVSQARSERWSRVAALWAPWYQARPEIRARVVTAGGDVHWLDPATLTELPRYEDSPNVLSDWLQVRAPLPAVGVGAVVEEEILFRDLEPVFAAGSARRFRLGHDGKPVELARMVVEAPRELPLRFATDLVDLEPESSEQEGLVRRVFDFGRVTGPFRWPANLPPDVPRRPTFAMATGASWADVAGGYHEIVETALAGFEPSSQVAQALGDEQGTLDRRQTITALVRWLHREVRYTGLEYGEAAIVPRPPAETLSRRYGDCKDKSVLLAGLLRGAGIPAHLALLRAGPSRDVFTDLPGLGQFDHVIVYVPPGSGPGEGELWIDATAEHARVGQLPQPDRDRWALVVRPESEALVKTPAPTSADDLNKQHQEVFLAAAGPSRVVETVEYHGAPERQMRQIFATLGPERARKVFSEGILKATQADEIGRLEIFDPHDLSGPMTVTIEVLGSGMVVTALDAAEVGFDLTALVASLHGELDADEEDEDEAEDERRADFEIREPYTAEHSLRVVPAAGYRPVDLPAGSTREIGTARLTTEVAATDAGEVTVRAVFGSGPRRLTPAQLTELRAALREVVDDGTLVLRFQHVGEAHLAAGRVGEALRELRRLAELEPGEALHFTRVARGLLAAGLGEAARREARRAVELDPASDLTHQTLGLVLSRDLIGREFAPGMDAEGAERAWLKAKELDPDNSQNRVNLAVLYEHDDEGIRYGARARLDDAIAEYRSLRDDLGVADLDDNLLIALFRAGRFAECRAFAEEIGTSTVLRSAYRVAATVAESGFDAGHELAASLGDDERGQVLETAAHLAVEARRYELAADLFAAAARGRGRDATALLGWAAVLRKTRPFEEMGLDPADPRSTFQHLTIAIAFDDTEGLAPILRMSEANGLPREQIAEHLALTRTTLKSAASLKIGLDLTLIDDDLAVDGDAASGYRLRVLDGSGGLNDVAFFAPDEHGLRLVALQNLSGLAPIGGEVLRLLEADRETAARRWLDWAREHAQAPNVDDPYSGDPVVRFWKRGGEEGPEVMRWAALSLLATGYRAAEVLPEIEEGLAAVATEQERARLEAAHLRALLQIDRHPETAAAARAALAAEPTSLTAFQMLTYSLQELERWDEIEQTAAQRLERLPGDVWALRTQASVAEVAGDLGRADEILVGMAAAGTAEWIDYNNLAWLSVVRNAVDDSALEHAQNAVRLSQQASGPSLHTLATIFAELGEAAAARDVILEAMAVNGTDDPGSEDWYVLGRIAEHYGLAAAAVEAYRKVDPPEEEQMAGISTHFLAQRRLAALQAADGR